MTAPAVHTDIPTTSGDAPTSAQLSNYAPTRKGGGTPTSDAPDWRQSSACADVDPEMFFPTVGGRYGTGDAIEVCNSCTVRAQCLAWALANGPVAGVWGGTTPRTRARMTRREA